MFWALRGGGNNFGIVTNLVIEAFANPPRWYAFQRWDMRVLQSVFENLAESNANMPEDIAMIATTLAWDPSSQQFILSVRTLASKPPRLTTRMSFVGDSSQSVSMPVSEQYIYRTTALATAKKMDVMNMDGFYNLFGSITVTNNVETFMQIATVFQEEVLAIVDTHGLQVFIVYNPLTLATVQKMQTRGGNALGIKAGEAPLNSKHRC